MVADHEKVKHQLAIAKGQLDGISKMVDEDAYCVDVSNQLLATISLLKRLNAVVLSAHLEGCVKKAASSGNAENLDCKIKEIQDLLRRMSD